MSTAATWHRRFGRNLKYNARPLAILAPMAPVRFVYDMADTEGDPLSAAQLSPPAVSDGRLRDICSNTVFNGAFHGIAVREAPRERPPGPGTGPGFTVSITKRPVAKSGTIRPKPLKSGSSGRSRASCGWR